MRALLNGFLSVVLLAIAWLFWASKEPAYKPLTALFLSALFGNTAIGHTRRYRASRTVRDRSDSD